MAPTRMMSRILRCREKLERVFAAVRLTTKVDDNLLFKVAEDGSCMVEKTHDMVESVKNFINNDDMKALMS